MTIASSEKTKTTHPLVSLQEQLEARKTDLYSALPKHIDPDRFIETIKTACQLNLDLLTVDRPSLWLACKRAAQDGCYPDGHEAVILPYRDTKQNRTVAQYQIMVAGLLKRFRNSGQFRSVATNIVRENEAFEYFIDECGEHLRHVPGDGSGKPVKAYAVAVTRDNGSMIKVMNVADIEKRRNVSKAKQGPMWTQWWEEAAQKTVLRNLSKRLPMSSDLAAFIGREDEDYDFNKPPPVAEPPHQQIRDVTGALDAFGSPEEGAELSDELDLNEKKAEA